MLGRDEELEMACVARVEVQMGGSRVQTIQGLVSHTKDFGL